MRASDCDQDRNKYVSKLTLEDFPCDAKSLLTQQSLTTKKRSPPIAAKEVESVTSLNTVQNLEALETQIQGYEQDIRKHISVEH